MHYMDKFHGHVPMTHPLSISNSFLIIQVAAQKTYGVLRADLLELFAGSISVAGQVVDGAARYLSLWLQLEGEMRAHLPAGLLDHGLGITSIQASIGKN